MSFYKLSKAQRTSLTAKIIADITAEIKSSRSNMIRTYFEDDDTYIRKSAYLAVGKIYFAYKNLQQKIIIILDNLLPDDDFKISKRL